jgi:hypothetical protein
VRLLQADIPLSKSADLWPLRSRCVAGKLFAAFAGSSCERRDYGSTLAGFRKHCDTWDKFLEMSVCVACKPAETLAFPMLQ